MKNISFIRHRLGKEREVSDGTDVFLSPLVPGESYQDVLSFVTFEKEKNIMYTMGKHFFPRNKAAAISMPRWMLVFVDDGELYCGAQRLCKGDFMVAPSSCAYDIFTKKETVLFYWCTTSDERLIDILRLCGYGDDRIAFGHTEHIRSIVELFERTVYRFPSGCDERVYIMGRMTCVFSYITAALTEPEDISDQIFKRCLRRIVAMSGNVTVEDLAKHYFVSRWYLYSMFKEYKNMSPFEYILQVRMETADKYLVSTDYSVQKIAELSGYSNYSHFTRAFTKYFGISPSRRRHEAKLRDIASEETDTEKKKLLLDE